MINENLHNLTNEELVVRFKNGEDTCMEIIMERFKPIIKTISRRYFLQGGDTDDLLQEGMIGLYKSLQSFNPLENEQFKLYAILCIKRQMFDAIKMAGAKKHNVLNSAKSIDRTKAEEMQSFVVEDEYIKQEEHSERLRKVNQKISPVEQSILKYYLDGLSYKEIALMFNINVKQVDNALSQIKKKIKQK